jgi:lysophospholipase L1-like esterase
VRTLLNHALISGTRRTPIGGRAAAGVLVAMVILGLPALHAQRPGAAPHWVGTWATAPEARARDIQQRRGPGGGAPEALVLGGRTLRQIVHTSIGGTRVRVVFSNAFGTDPLRIGAAHVALREKDSAIRGASGGALTFAGSASAVIAAGAVLVSDPVTVTLPAMSDVAVDLFLPNEMSAAKSPFTVHNEGLQTNYISTEGNHAGAAQFPVATTATSWFFLSRLEVTAPGDARAIVTLGDSITDGYASTVDTNNRWPDHLAKHLTGTNGRLTFGVLNEGIDGNRVLVDGLGVSAQARFDRDVLGAGAAYLVILEGINDLGMSRPPRTSAAELILGHQQLIERAHHAGLKVFGATLTPYEGANFKDYFSPEGEATRQKLNEWIRTSKAYDAVIDFDAVMRDPEHPSRMLALYDSGDHLHPSDAGYQAMAKAIDVALFQRK